MTSRRSMTRDIHESIRLVLGKNVKILLKAPMKHELKGDKTENRILVFTAHRIFIMTSKVPAKIDHHIHYLDLRHIESKKLNHIAFTCLTNGDKTTTYSFRSSEDTSPNPEAAVDEILVVLITTIKRIFPKVPLENIIGKIDLKPVDRRLVNHPAWNDPDSKLIGPCGGFSAQYACMCDYYGLPFREEVAWDVDTIYFSHDSHELCLQDFEHLDHRDLLCIISSLEHNTWFNKLKASGNNVKLPQDICDRILQVFAKSTTMQELHLPSIGARWEFAAKFGQAIAQNKLTALTSFDFSCNFIEDKGLNHISTFISKHPKGLRHLNLSYCSLATKGISNFASSLTANSFNASTLTYLNLAGNTIKEDSHALCSFLAQPNVIAILDVSSTETPIDALFGALVRGCTTSLTHLNLSRNPFSSKKAKEIPAAFKQFFAATLTLQYLNVSHCKMPPEAVKHLLLGLACNETTTNVELNLSCNNLGASGASVLESCIGGVKCISRLDLSENNIDAEMSGVMQGMVKNKSILSLNLSRNMNGIKAKHMPAVMESIVQVIQDEESVLQKLNLTDCKLKHEINNIINALGSNQSLQHLDITGNLMGDVGARLLAKALQINTRLRIINLDRNGITLQGYTDIIYALQSNYSMRHIPFPTYDLQQFIKTHPDRVDSLIHRMQELLQRNSNPNRFRNTSQAFRLTQGFLLSSTQQILDRVSAQTQDNIDAMLKLNPEKSDLPEIVDTKRMIQDAENSKHLLSALHEASAKGTEVDLKLKQVSLDLNNFIASHVQKNVESMLTCAESQCPSVLSQNDGKCKSEMRAICQKKCQIPTDFVSTLIMDQLGQEIHNKVNELNLIIANNISDRVIDEVIEGLGTKSKLIVSEAGSLKKKRSLTPDVLKGRSSSLSESLEHESASQASIGDATSQKSDASPLSTPQTNKRKSLHGRKLRPKSISESHEKDCISETSNNITTGDASSTDSLLKDTEDNVPELPATTGLQHLGKARPKRPKKHAPSRGAVAPNLNSSDITDDEAIQKFYSPNNTSFSAGSTPSQSPLRDDISPVPPKKDTEKSRSNLFLGSKKGNLTSPDTDKKSPAAKSKGISPLISSLTEEGAHSKKDSSEKRSLSPSLHSITDIFHKKDSKSPSGLSPFSSRKTDDIKKKSTANDDSKDDQHERTLSPDLEGKKSPEEVVKRHGVGYGGNSNLMAEMKEKRASMVAKTPTEGDLSPSKSLSVEDPNKNIFGHVKLRSTGLAQNLSSPTNEFNNTIGGQSEDSEENKGSIVGLKAFSASSTTNSTNVESSATPVVPKPKPLPKPRPWSIVGVDRKSGEVTSVSDSSSKTDLGGASKKSTTKTESTPPIPAARKSTVRDMINNMNKAGGNSSTEATPTEGFVRKKGSSLPRGINPPNSSSSIDETKSLSRSPNLTASNTNANTNSPKVKKRSESTNDDPRILKLDDDFGYDVMEV